MGATLHAAQVVMFTLVLFALVLLAVALLTACSIPLPPNFHIDLPRPASQTAQANR